MSNSICFVCIPVNLNLDDERQSKQYYTKSSTTSNMLILSHFQAPTHIPFMQQLYAEIIFINDLFFFFWWHLYFHIERTTANEMHTHTKSNHRWEKTTHSNISLPSLENGVVYIMLNECDSVILIKINERVTVHNVALRLHLNTNNHEKKTHQNKTIVSRMPGDIQKAVKSCETLKYSSILEPIITIMNKFIARIRRRANATVPWYVWVLVI